MITHETNVYLFQIYADCTPILFADPGNQAIGIAHAGWRGTASTITKATVRHMQECFNSNPADIIALVGPAIGGCCYEVSDEVSNAIVESTGSHSIVTMGRQGRRHVDLAEANRLQLLTAGVASHNVFMSNICTSCHVHSYFSHRAEAGQAGRFAAVIGLRPDISDGENGQ